ncbi:synergin gamma-like isoform X2 [Athalia rosae]|uniref:synergin gamma-like isoform X2 n=1 Tax=Athalia rosae TaxID=37344 RepID=UPI0020344629|nr:synergin gamma-like isoform X2 [Athalia rosae]
MNRNNHNMDKKLSQLPSWLWTTSNSLPGVYRQIWEGVKENRSAIYASSSTVSEVLVDTNKVFPLLLTSQLPTEVLGYIWSLANHKFAGQLTEQELYVVLALVAIAQASYTFNSLDILHLMPSPPIPSLNLSLIEGKQIIQPVKFEPKTQLANSSFDANDEFSDFQSAAPVNAIPSLPMLDTKQGSAIGSRLANHNLGVKKSSDKPKKTNACKHASGSQFRNSNSNSSSTTHNKDQIAIEQITMELFPKCSLKTQSKVVILKDTAIRSSEVLKDNNVNSRDPIHFMDNIPAVDNTVLKLQESRDKILPKKEPEASRLDLMSTQPVEDKYSALRVLIEQPQTPKLETDLAIETAMDDFGDFVSAQQPEPPSQTLPAQESVDFFSSFDFKDSNNDCATENTLDQQISDSFSNLRVESVTDPSFSIEKSDINNDPVIQKEDNISVNSIELGSGSLNCIPRSGSVPSLDLKCFLTNSQDEDHQIENMHQLIYWEWKQYMESCVLLLQVAANIFTSIASEEVLQEVLSTAQGYNFLCNLAEVAAVCRRVNFSHKELDINIMGFDDLLMDIDRTWAEMEPFYSNIPVIHLASNALTIYHDVTFCNYFQIVTELPVWPLHQGENITCSLCLTVVTSGRIVCNENSYHVTCANLWLNCVNNHLPVLSYPPPLLSTTSLSNSHV